MTTTILIVTPESCLETSRCDSGVMEGANGNQTYLQGTFLVIDVLPCSCIHLMYTTVTYLTYQLSGTLRSTRHQKFSA